MSHYHRVKRERCKGKNNNGSDCKHQATICGYCVTHFCKIKKIKTDKQKAKRK